MHFCDVAARTYGRLSKPRNTSLNWFIPALVNSSVGSSPGTTGLDGTTVWPFDSKNLRNVEGISEAFIAVQAAARGPRSPSPIGGSDFTRGGAGERRADRRWSVASQALAGGPPPRVLPPCDVGQHLRIQRHG